MSKRLALPDQGKEEVDVFMVDPRPLSERGVFQNGIEQYFEGLPVDWLYRYNVRRHLKPLAQARE